MDQLYNHEGKAVSNVYILEKEVDKQNDWHIYGCYADRFHFSTNLYTTLSDTTYSN